MSSNPFDRPGSTTPSGSSTPQLTMSTYPLPSNDESLRDNVPLSSTSSSTILADTTNGGNNDIPIDDEPFDNNMVISESSKREYLLAQIRQKDAIIESLLKQVCPVHFF